MLWCTLRWPQIHAQLLKQNLEVWENEVLLRTESLGGGMGFQTKELRLCQDGEALPSTMAIPWRSLLVEFGAAQFLGLLLLDFNLSFNPRTSVKARVAFSVM